MNNINSKLLLKATMTGPGGWDCPCCGPKPKDKRLYSRIARHRLKVYLDKVSEEAYDTGETA